MAANVDSPSVGVVSQLCRAPAPNTTSRTASGAARRSARGTVIARVVTVSTGTEPVTSPTPGIR